MTEATATWLYAIAEAPQSRLGTALEQVAGVAGEPVRTLAAEGLSAVVGSVPLSDFGEEALRSHLEDLPWLERAARAHHRVIEAAAGAARVVPLRFATVYDDDARVGSLLAECRDTFLAALRRVAGRTEWGVKAYVDPGSIERESEPAAPGAADSAGSPGTAYLLRRKAQRDQQHTARQRALERAEEIHAVLAGASVAAVRHRPQDPRLAEYEGWMVLNSSYLVPDEGTAEYTEVLRGLERRFPEVRLELSGPWPPYSFAGSEGPEP